MRLGKKLEFEDLLNMNGEEVYVKEIEHAELLKTPIQICKVVIKREDEVFDWSHLGHEEYDYDNDYDDDEYEEPEMYVSLINEQHQYFYDDGGDCEDGEFEVYRKMKGKQKLKHD